MMRFTIPRWAWWLLGWTVVIVLFAWQWRTMDGGDGRPPFADYLRWSAQQSGTWALLTPAALWIAKRYPIEAHDIPRALTLHLAASIALTAVASVIEPVVVLVTEPRLPPLPYHLHFVDALVYVVDKHTATSLVTYWVIVGIAQIGHRELRAAQLETQLARAQLQALRVQLRPHFLFNTLHAIGQLVHEDPSGAEEMLVGLGHLLRASLAEEHAQEIPLERELEVLAWYLGIEQRRFQERLAIDIAVDEAALECAVPALVLQPLVENALRHGIGRREGCDTIMIRGTREGGMVTLSVQNANSVLDDPDGGRGVGLSNTRARLSHLYGVQANLSVTPLSPTGVAATITLPARPAAS